MMRSNQNKIHDASRQLTSFNHSDIDACEAACEIDHECQGVSWNIAEGKCRLQSDFGEAVYSNDFETIFKPYIAVPDISYATGPNFDVVINTTRTQMSSLCDYDFSSACIGFVLVTGTDQTQNGTILTQVDAKSKRFHGNSSGVSTYLRENNFTVMRILGESDQFEVSVTTLKLHSKPLDSPLGVCTCQDMNNRLNFLCPSYLKDEAQVEISCGLPPPTDATGTCSAPKCKRTPLYTNFFCKDSSKVWPTGDQSITCDRGDNVTVTVYERSSSADVYSQFTMDPMEVATLPAGSDIRHMTKVGGANVFDLMSAVVAGLTGLQTLCIRDQVTSAEIAPAAAMTNETSSGRSLWRKTGKDALKVVANLTGKSEDIALAELLEEEAVLNGASLSVFQSTLIGDDLFVRLPGVKIPNLITTTTTEANLEACEDECRDNSCDAFTVDEDLLSGSSGSCRLLNTAAGLVILVPDSDSATFVRAGSSVVGRLVDHLTGNLLGEVCTEGTALSSTLSNVISGLSGQAVYEVGMRVASAN
eukprot:CAMPEP_0181296474 /NCGR_PEP_ID=MMETSP1101-20121128/4725_1 /TAXON_ID=46948 /ORGANISM="Rhodomonas abbreviata, Strain Caron Lab Isolate" /LENGTH=530 /DNA_ID=CAMNT_0023401345 /DNA_START=193 /DNA_END=1785 /DNA_ORIENTATION=-